MESIVLGVDEASAKAWNNSSPSSRATYESKIIAIVKEFQEVKAVDENGFTKEQLEFLKTEAAKNTERYEWWNDEEMVAEIERRSEDMKSGKVKGISWEEAKTQILNRVKKE
jgi:putative addiction module component (TIGR02574 family)